MKHLKLLVRYSCNECDPVRLARRRAAGNQYLEKYLSQCLGGLQDKRHACQGHPSRSCSQRWRAAKIQTRPVIWLGNQIHAYNVREHSVSSGISSRPTRLALQLTKEKYSSSSRQEQQAQGGRVPPQRFDVEAAVRQVSYQRRRLLPWRRAAPCSMSQQL